jgi:CMP-N,N'-diacetyllegionaminic acid synthase
MLILAVITARGGSITLPRKNILSFCGKPLIAHTIEAALDARRMGAPIHRIIVSTEDPEISSISRRWGAEVPFTRPPDLARADTPSLPVVQHAVAFAEQDEGRRYGWVLLLQPTSPLRRGEDIGAALDLIHRPDTTAIVSLTDAAASHPKKLRLIDNGMLRPFLDDGLQPVRRQDFGLDIYKTNGAIYLVRRDVLMEENSFYGSSPRPFVMPPERSIDIDTQLDFEIAEFLYRRSRRLSNTAHDDHC